MPEVKLRPKGGKRIRHKALLSVVIASKVAKVNTAQREHGMRTIVAIQVAIVPTDWGHKEAVISVTG